MEGTEVSSMRPARWRLNVSTTSKGLPSYEVTLDGQDSGMEFEEIESKVEMAIAVLMVRYPSDVPL